MINIVFETLKKEVSEYLVRLPELKVTNEEVVSISPVVKYNGDVAIPDKSLGLSLVNIEEERVMKSQKCVSVDANGMVSHFNPEINLNLFLLITANFNDYDTGLKFLSGAIRFFQSKSVFTPDNTPGLDPVVKKLIVELHSLSFEQQNHLWGSLGAKFMPSVLYKVRMLSIQEAQKADEQPPVYILDISGQGM